MVVSHINSPFFLSYRSLFLSLCLWQPSTKIRFPPIPLWPVHFKMNYPVWLFGKDPDPGKHWGQKEKRLTEDEVVGWHLWFNRHELWQTLGDVEGQGSLVCCSLWGSKMLDATCQLNNNIQYDLWNVFLKENHVIFFFSLTIWMAGMWHDGWISKNTSDHVIWYRQKRRY